MWPDGEWDEGVLVEDDLVGGDGVACGEGVCLLGEPAVGPVYVWEGREVARVTVEGVLVYRYLCPFGYITIPGTTMSVHRFIME